MTKSDNAVKDVGFPKTNKTVIILTYSFPPDNRISALRPFKMAEAFTKKGWDVHVLRCENNGADKNGFKDLSRIKVSGFHSSWLSGLLAGNFKAGGGVFGGGSIFVKLLRRFFLPDHSFLMRKHMESSLNKLSSTYNPSCIVSISYPFVSHLAAKNVVKLNATPVWVADNRDMWSGNPYRGFGFFPAFLERKIEEKCFSRADIVSFASEETRKIYARRYGLDNTLSILNGFESGVSNNCDYGSNAKSETLQFVHTGSLYNGRRLIEPLLEAVEKISSRLNVQCEILLYGNGCDHLVDAEMCYKKNKLVDLRLMGLVSRDQAYEAQRSADFLVVSMGREAFDKTYVPAKIFEYARERKPVISICDSDSELASITRGHNLGVATYAPEAIADYVVNSVKGFGTPSVDVEVLSADFQFGKLVSEIEGRLGIAKGP
jgi:glycosyltransferase involved in cell wall biosynthesis